MVELLTVFLLVAVLASLLGAGLSTAKARAKRIQCTSNLRQIGVGFTMYTLENHFYPADFVDFGNSLVNYAKVTPIPGRPAPNVDLSEILLFLPPLFQCPTKKDFLYGFNYWGSGGRSPLERGLPTLGLNGALQPPQARARLSSEQVRVPSDMIAFGEIANWSLPFAANGSMSFYDFGYQARFHRDGANVAFCDGHVEFAVEAKIDRGDARMRRRWNNDNEPHPECWNPP